MQTITFYSYKGGTGRSLALANATIYLATLGFKVVALDFDLEAPGLHYKFSRNRDGSPLAIQKGLIDYVIGYLSHKRVDLPLKDFYTEIAVPGVDKPLVYLVPAGNVPSSDYWSKLARIDWHNLFYSKGASGVKIFMELKARISDELKPDFLLVDSRTGITEMGGVATTLFADKVLCLVLPTPENLQGARAVLRSLKRARREANLGDLEVMLALSRLPQMRGAEDERQVSDRILSEMNEEADDPNDSLQCQSVNVLHSETALQVQEALRVGSGINPDDSILLRDYLRLFAKFVPRESIEPKVHDLIEKAWAKLRDDPDGALKEVEELTESFSHPENYRELLRFYHARNVGATLTLRRAQRLWELSGDSSDPILWQALARSFEPLPRFRRENQWSPNLDFVLAVWRDAGQKNAAFGMKLANAYDLEDRESLAADVLLEVIKSSELSAPVVARCIGLLDVAKRTEETERLIQQFKTSLASAPEFANAWARHAIRTKNKAAFLELTKSPWAEKVRPALRVVLFANAGLTEDAVAAAEHAMGDLREPLLRWELEELAKQFHTIGRWEEFEAAIREIYPPDMIRDIGERLGFRPRRR
jgi:MinD-like ATPase involved in chromosome partitioning or flagellar assembly